MIEISCDFMYFRSEAHVIVWNGKDNLAFDSGTGKTFLFRELLGLDSQHRLYSNKHLIMSDDVRVLSTMSYTSDDCVIIDEANLKPHHLYDLFCKIRDANAYIIVMGRLLIAQLEYAVNSIYEFELDVDREFSIINHVYLNEAFQNSTRKSVQNDIPDDESLIRNLRIFDNGGDSHVLSRGIRDVESIEDTYGTSCRMQSNVFK